MAVLMINCGYCIIFVWFISEENLSSPMHSILLTSFNVLYHGLRQKAQGQKYYILLNLLKSREQNPWKRKQFKNRLRSPESRRKVRAPKLANI